jgi:hypothetical protein
MALRALFLLVLAALVVAGAACSSGTPKETAAGETSTETTDPAVETDDAKAAYVAGVKELAADIKDLIDRGGNLQTTEERADVASTTAVISGRVNALYPPEGFADVQALVDDAGAILASALTLLDMNETVSGSTSLLQVRDALKEASADLDQAVTLLDGGQTTSS